MIVIVKSNVKDGTRVAWFVSRSRWSSGTPIVAASRHGVYVSGWLDRIPDQVLTDAQDVANALKADRHADMQNFATHELRGGDIVPLPYGDQCTCLGSCKKLDCDCVCHQMPSHGDKGE